MRSIFLSLVFVVISFSASAQLKPEAMLLPISFVNFKDTAIQISLKNYIQTELSKYFEIKSDAEVKQAMEFVIDELDSEICTEEECKKLMGRRLDVDYTFHLKIINTRQDWDLFVIRTQNFEESTIRLNEPCSDCSLPKARKLISKMLSSMRGKEVSLSGGKALLSVDSNPKSKVFIDGYPQGDTPVEISVNANKLIELLMVAEGYNDYSKELILKPGETKKEHPRLTRRRGILRITSNPSGAKIYINGEPAIDSNNKHQLTPAELSLVYGQHVLKFELEKYEVIKKRLRINKRNAGSKNIVLKPKPGRLIIRVPSEHKQARIQSDDKYLGSMDGSIVKNFEVAANVRHSLQAEDGNFKSKTKTVRIEPDGSEKVEFEKFYETRKKLSKKPFKFPKFDDINYSDWSGENISLNNSVNSYNVILANRIKLGYTLVSLGLNWKNIQIVFSSTAIGEDSIKESTTNESVDSFYYSDGNETREVVSTNASFTRITYSPNLDEFGTKYVKNRNPENSWIWGAGLEFSNVTLKTRNDGERKISASSPLIEGGYQWNWGNIGGMTGIFINLQIHLIISASTRVQFVSSSSTVGYIF